MGVVLGGPHDQLGCTVETRTNVGNTCFPFPQFLSRPQVTNHQVLTPNVDQDVFRLDVSVRNVKRVQVADPSQHLVRIDFHQNIRELLFLLVLEIPDET